MKRVLSAVLVMVAVFATSFSTATAAPESASAVEVQDPKECLAKFQTELAKATATAAKPATRIDVPGCYSMETTIENSPIVTEDVGAAGTYCRNPNIRTDFYYYLPSGIRVRAWTVQSTMRTCWNDRTSNITSFTDPPTVTKTASYPWSVTIDDKDSQWENEPEQALGTVTFTASIRPVGGELWSFTYAQYIEVFVCGNWNAWWDMSLPE